MRDICILGIIFHKVLKCVEGSVVICAYVCAGWRNVSIQNLREMCEYKLKVGAKQYITTDIH